jgi:hypothetical protein
MANFPFNDDGTLASTIGEHGARVPTQAALDALDALLDDGDTGGGVTNSAGAGQIAVSDGTNLTGSANLTWDDAANTSAWRDENGSGTIEAIGVGGQLFIRAQDGDATHVGGEVHISTGRSDGQSGGALTIETGRDTGGGDGGTITISNRAPLMARAATSTSGSTQTTPSAVGGNILIQAGTGQTGNGGDIFISAGAKVTGGTNGSVQILDGTGNSIEMNPSGTFLFGGIVILDSLPTSDPGNLGQVFTNGAPSAGVPKALMVSGG